MSFLKSSLREHTASDRAEYDGPLFDGKDRHALSKPAFGALSRSLRPTASRGGRGAPDTFGACPQATYGEKLRPSLPRPRATDAAHGTVPIDLDQCAHAVK